MRILREAVTGIIITIEISNNTAAIATTIEEITIIVTITIRISMITETSSSPLTKISLREENSSIITMVIITTTIIIQREES